MFVDRDHWYGAPLHNDGTVTSKDTNAKRFNMALNEVGLEDMETTADVGVVGNRLYSWFRLMPSEKALPYIPRLLDDSTVGFCRDLMRLKLNYRCPGKP